MAEEKRIVIPTDMGKTIEFGSKEPDKWNVKIGHGLRVGADGSIEATGGGGTTDVCAYIKSLAKRNSKPGDYVLGVGADGQCAMIKLPSDPFDDFSCKLPYSVESESNVSSKGDRIGLTYEFTNNYDNAVSFKFLIADASAPSFSLKTAPAKLRGGGTVRNLNTSQVNIQVDHLPAGQKIKFSVAITPNESGRYSFGVHGLADTSGGNQSGLNTCGNSVGINVLDGGR